MGDIRYYIQGFLLKQRAQRHSPHTIKFYQWNLNRFAWFLEAQGYPTQLAAVTPNMIRHFFVYLGEQTQARWGSNHWAANKPLSPHGIHAFARAVRAFFHWAAKEGGLPFNPFSNVEMPSLPNAWKVQTYNEADIVALFAACNTFEVPFVVQRDRAILAILLDTGLRASELLSLEVGDIDPQVSMFQVTGKGQKKRAVVVGSYARKELWAYLTQFRLRMATPYSELWVSHKGTPLTYFGLKQMFR
jgi:site-specific recombinase XerD